MCGDRRRVIRRLRAKSTAAQSVAVLEDVLEVVERDTPSR
jgi:hypothetical protein